MCSPPCCVFSSCSTFQLILKSRKIFVPQRKRLRPGQIICKRLSTQFTRYMGILWTHEVIEGVVSEWVSYLVCSAFEDLVPCSRVPWMCTKNIPALSSQPPTFQFKYRTQLGLEPKTHQRPSQASIERTTAAILANRCFNISMIEVHISNLGSNGKHAPLTVQ